MDELKTFLVSPTALLIGFVASVLTIAAYVFGWTSLCWTWIRGYFSGEPDVTAFQADDRFDVVPESPLQMDQQSVDRCEQVRQTIQRKYLQGFGETGRYNYFATKTAEENGNDALFRSEIESFANDPAWAHCTAAADEWVTIGYDSLVRRADGWRGESTLNKLYAAANRLMLTSDELQLSYGKHAEFARMIASRVAARRRKDHGL